jgi:hypothetical protein
MFTVKARLFVVLILVVGLGTASFAVAESPSRPKAVARGRLLSEREMAATFGDADTTAALGGNLLCVSQQNCFCSRTGTNDGQAGCLMCDDQNHNGTNKAWKVCCATSDTTLNCSDNGPTSPCDGLTIWFTNSSTNQNNCCNQCFPTSPFVDTTKSCRLPRGDAQGNNCPAP